MKTSPLAFLVFVIHLVAVTTFVGAQCDPVVDCNENGISDERVYIQFIERAICIKQQFRKKKTI